MSGVRGTPIYLTNGERKLLIPLLQKEMERLNAEISETVPSGAAKDAARRVKVRIRQYKRMILELTEIRGDLPGQEG